MGKIILDPVNEGQTDVSLAHLDFLATRLLPCSLIDGGVQKFTGNDDCGAAPARNDLLTMAIHAFAHFVVVYSKEAFLLCDLQGKTKQFLFITASQHPPGRFDKDRVMCLFDPQNHS